MLPVVLPLRSFRDVAPGFCSFFCFSVLRIAAFAKSGESARPFVPSFSACTPTFLIVGPPLDGRPPPERRRTFPLLRLAQMLSHSSTVRSVCQTADVRRLCSRPVSAFSFRGPPVLPGLIFGGANLLPGVSLNFKASGSLILPAFRYFTQSWSMMR